MIIEKLLKTVLEIEDLLDEYYVVVYGNDSAPIHKLNETELLTKESILKDIQVLITRLNSDIKSFGKSQCISITQLNAENRNLVDLVNEVKHTLLRLKRFGLNDSKVNELFEQLKTVIDNFKKVLVEYIVNSPFKVYTWVEAQHQADLEIKSLEEDFANLLK